MSAELKNGELLKEIYDSVKNTERDVAVIKNEQANQTLRIDANTKDIERLKFKILPIAGAVGLLIAFLVEWSKK